MTIKTRNRLNNIFFIFSVAVFVLNITFFILRSFFDFPISGNDYEGFFHSNTSNTLLGRILFDYKPVAVYVSLFFLNFYVCAVSYYIMRAFEKTQNSEVTFFLLFLIACLSETSRLYIPSLDIGGAYSGLLIALGNLPVFSRILAPLSFLFSVLMSIPEERQNLEKNLAVVLVASFFSAVTIPLNTNVIEPNFTVRIGFNKTIVAIDFVTSICTIFSIFVFNAKNRNNQKTAIGLVLVIAGFFTIVNGSVLFSLFLGMVLLGTGTCVYLLELHNRYLYD